MGIKKIFELMPKDGGATFPLFAWDMSSMHVAVCSNGGKVRIMTREGKTLNTLSFSGVIKLAWDYSRNVLAIIQSNKSSVSFFSVDTRGLEVVDTGLQELCFVAWSPVGSRLAVCTAKGSFVVINSETLKKTPIVGTHTQRIISAHWTMNNMLVMIGEDNFLSVSDADGVLQQQATLESSPVSLALIDFAHNGAGQLSCKAVALVNYGKTIEHYNLETMRHHVVPFESKLGSITVVKCISDGSTFIGFNSGIIALAAVSLQNVNVQYVMRVFEVGVRDISCLIGTGMFSAVGDNALKFFSVTDNKFTEIKKDSIELEVTYGQILAVEWSRDGSSITLSVEKGHIINYAMNLCTVSTSNNACIYYMTSSRIVSAKSLHDGRILYTAAVDIDFTIIAAAQTTLAVGALEKVVYYAVDGNKDVRFIASVEYPSVVTALKVSSKHAAVLFDGKVRLHEINATDNSIIFPENRNTSVISMDMSEALFMYATSEKICIVNLSDYKCVVEHAPSVGIKRAVANLSCTRIAIIGKNDALYIFNPITLVLTQTEGYEPNTKNILWDNGDYGVLASFNDREMITYVYSPHSRYGPTSESVVVKDTNSENLITSIPAGYTPICLFKGVVTFKTAGGSLDTVTLNSHSNTTTRSPNSEAFYNNFSLNHLRWASQNITTPQEAEDLAVKALHMLDIELAIRLYRQLSQPSLVMCLENIKHINEKNLLIGHISMIMGFFKDAQTFFLRSSQPLCALQMRHDLMQWEPALALARQMAPERVPIISKEYAQQLEYRGEYVKALEMFRAGERTIPKGHPGAKLTAAHAEIKAHNAICLQGAARCLLRTGSLKEGVKMALESSCLSHMVECAQILESLQQYEEAAQLYEKASDFDRAAKLYIQEAKNMKEASRLIPKITSRNIIVMFAKAKENDGDFKEAEQAYMQAEDWDNVVRIKVENLNDLHGAYVVVRRTRSAAAAAVVANMCKNKNEFASAVEFFVLAKSFQEAFDLAKEKNCMSILETSLLNQVQLTDGVAPSSSQTEFAMIAQYYGQKGKPGQAGLFYYIAGNYPLALKNYIEAGEPEDLERAIQVVGKSRSDALTNKLIDYLMGETDGEPKEPSYIFKLYMALGSYEKAAKTSLLIATKEQEIGSYRNAHKTLLEAYLILREKKLHVPNDLRRSLMLLHSYIIVKHLIKPMGDEKTASRMLLRVVRNIQRFPRHISAIYTSTALQCLRSGFKKSAFDNACIIIQNVKYRTELEDKNRKKIEGIVRRHGKEEIEDPPEETSPCPFCDTQLPETELDCSACKNNLPFCIITGKHMAKDNYSQCPCCKFPALYSSFMIFLRDSQSCPMCMEVIDLNKVERITDPDLREYIA